MNGSAADGPDVPDGVVTVTSTAPVPAGLSAVIVVSLTTTRPVAAVGPKSTSVAPVKPAPMIFTDVPPAGGPLVGLMPVTVGAGVREQIGERRRRRARRGGHGHVHEAGARRAVGRDRGVVDDDEARRRRRAKVDCRGAGEASAGDRDQSATHRRAGCRAHARDRRRREQRPRFHPFDSRLV